MTSNETPYVLGYMSYYSQVPKIGNPYPSDSQEHGEWDEGWEQAQKESESEVNDDSF